MDLATIAELREFLGIDPDSFKKGRLSMECEDDADCIKHCARWNSHISKKACWDGAEEDIKKQWSVSRRYTGPEEMENEIQGAVD